MPDGDEAQVLTSKAAAEVLEISEQTLRHRDKAAKLRVKRHSINGYRLYSRRQVLELRRQILSGIQKAS